VAAVAAHGDELKELTATLWEGIPLSAAAGIEVTKASLECVEVHAPFDLNRNYHGTGFGGSIAIVGIVTGWITVNRAMRDIAEVHEIVIQSSGVEYLEPARTDLIGNAPAPDAASVGRFLKTYGRFGRARMTVTSSIKSGGLLVARHEGVYAALRV
jgi:thioesterase domain-containing protein